MYNRVLISGSQKTGNTWCQFVIFNYWNIKNFNATKTLTFDELQKIHLRRKVKGFKHKLDGFPQVHHTHLPYDGCGFVKTMRNVPRYFNKFDKLIYLYRNPFDVMLSYYEFLFNREETPYVNNGFVKARGIDFNKLKKSLKKFTKYYLEIYIHHIKSTRHRADVILDYDILRKNAVLFGDAIKLIDDTLDEDILKKAIEFSSFDNIKKMSIETGKPYMRGGNQYKGFFCRDGRVGQYKEVMNKKLIKYIKKRWKEEGLELKNEIT